MTPILVVGAGPVGLTMASELSRFGVGVRIIDQNPHPTKTSRALVIWSRTLELMDRMGCTRTFLDAGLRAHGASMRAGQVVLGRPRFDDIASEYNFALMIRNGTPSAFSSSTSGRLASKWNDRSSCFRSSNATTASKLSSAIRTAEEKPP
jgi:FAD binding domain